MLTHHHRRDNLQTKLDFKDCVSVSYMKIWSGRRRVCRLARGYVVESVRRIMFDID